jgi:hypothetical protein
MDFLVSLILVLVVGLAVSLAVGGALWGAFPFWRHHSELGGQEPDPTGNLPPEPQGFEKPPDEGGLL